MHLILNINDQDRTPLYVQLYEGIRHEITKGQIKANTKMPSIRQLAKDLNMSKTTIESTYHQLLVEGYIYSKPKKGYFVKAIDHTWFHPMKPNPKLEKIKEVENIQYNLTNSTLEEGVFNTNLWKKMINKVLNEKGEELLSYGHFQGESILRDEIAKYLYEARGVSCTPHQIVIGAGIQQLLIILAEIFCMLDRKTLAFEDPGFNRAKDILNNSKLTLKPIKVHQEGIDIRTLYQYDVDACYISPSHQFPTGTIMPIDKRMALIQWAKNKNAFIIEDDYNSELRYHGRPIPSLQGLDHGEHVIYLGSFSTVFLPSTRISFMILPKELMKIYNKLKQHYPQSASKLEQLTLATYMQEGHFEKHIRKLKVYYTKKNEMAIKMIHQIFKDNATVNASDSGFNLTMSLKTSIDEREIKRVCKEKGILFNVLSDYSIRKRDEKYPVLLLSYKGIQLEDFSKALKEIYNTCFA